MQSWTGLLPLRRPSRSATPVGIRGSFVRRTRRGSCCRRFGFSRETSRSPYRDLKKSLGEPKSAVPVDRETALSSGGWWLRSVVGSGDEGVNVLVLRSQVSLKGASQRPAGNLSSSLAMTVTCLKRGWRLIHVHRTSLCRLRSWKRLRNVRFDSFSNEASACVPSMNANGTRIYGWTR